jgi:hypothetical protein
MFLPKRQLLALKENQLKTSKCPFDRNYQLHKNIDECNIVNVHGSLSLIATFEGEGIIVVGGDE